MAAKTTTIRAKALSPMGFVTVAGVVTVYKTDKWVYITMIDFGAITDLSELQ
jgi:hypothetical protein